MVRTLLFLLLVLCVEVSVTSWEGGGPHGGHDDSDVRCPVGCRCSDRTAVVSCVGSNLSRVPALPSTVTRLDLSSTGMHLLYNESFTRTPYLEHLTVENNGLIHIEAGSFSSLPHLRVLRLGGNHLSHLARHLFRSQRLLEVLDLHHNEFVELPHVAMSDLPGLRVLNVSANHMTSATLGPGFRTLRQLSLLDLSHNNIPRVEAGALGVAKWWSERVPHHLNLSHCGIRTLHPQALSRVANLASLSLAGNDAISAEGLRVALLSLDVTSLRRLDLSYMNLGNISDMFTRFEHQHMQELNLSHNELRTVPGRSFYYLVQLKQLDLSSNILTEIVDLTGLNHLEFLSLADNKITSVGDMVFEESPSLRSLDLSQNDLTYINGEPFENLWDLHTLKLQSNRITTFHVTSVLERLTTLDLSDNMVSDVTAFRRLPQLNDVDISSNVITHLPSDVFARGRTVSRTNFSRNIIMDIDPQSFRESSHDVLDLSLNKLSELRDWGWSGVRELHLQGNLITHITRSALTRLSTLSVLDLSDNSLAALPGGVFTEAATLHTLILGHNPLGDYLASPAARGVFAFLSRLRRLDVSNVHLSAFESVIFSNLSVLEAIDLSHNDLVDDVVTPLTSLRHLRDLDLSYNAFATPQPAAFERHPRLSRVDLAHNPFHCTCDLMPFRRWLNTTSRVTLSRKDDVTAYVCATPAEWRARPLRQFALDSASCASHVRVVIIALLACATALVVMAAAICLCRNRGCCARQKVQRTHYCTIQEASALKSTAPRCEGDKRDWL